MSWYILVNFLFAISIFLLILMFILWKIKSPSKDFSSIKKAAELYDEMKKEFDERHSN